MAKLIECPNGAWVDPNEVESIHAMDRSDQLSRGPTRPTLMVTMKSGNRMNKQYDEYAIALSERDRFVLLVNDARS